MITPQGTIFVDGITSDSTRKSYWLSRSTMDAKAITKFMRGKPQLILDNRKKVRLG